MTTISVRDVELGDIPVLNGYWQGLSDADIQRMFIDRSKILTPEEFTERVTKTIGTPLKERNTDPLIWELNGKAVGFTTLTNIERGKTADIHLHIVDPEVRGQGLGTQWFALSLKKYFQRHGLEKIVCTPASTNPGPNALLRGLGVKPVRTFVTTPSPICVEHEVSRYEIYGFGVPSEDIDKLAGA